MKLINLGFGSLIAANRLLAVVAPDSAPIKRVIQEARDRGMLIDASYGRKTKAVILMDTDHVILSALPPETIRSRWSGDETVSEEEEGMSKGKLFVISGASGVGKGTVLKEVMKRRQDLRFSVSATTRPPRPSEVDGREYYFVTRERFEEMIRSGEFLEYDEHDGNYYGTLRGQIEEKKALGPVLLDIEPMGAAQVRKAAADAVLVFIMPPSMEELERRLRDRKDTPEDQIRIRLERAVWEMEQRFWYDHVVVNDELERCVDEMLAILAGECGETA